MNKRGQFYMIAAVIIIVVISGLATITNSALIRPTPKAMDSMSSDLTEEGPRIIDYGIYSRQDLDKALKNFTSDEFAPYFLKKTENSNVVFIYGNKTDLSAVKYNLASKGTISATIGGSTSWNILGPYSEHMKIIPIGNNITITLLEKTYEFELKDNQIFYFIMAQQKNQETYIKKND